MGRHISFWIGFFAAALLIVPIALFAWGLAQERLFDLMAMVFGALVVLVVLLIVVLVFRGPILRKVLGRSEAGVEEITRSLVAGVSAAASGDVKRAEAEADTLARVAIGWYTWSNFYRWVIGTCVALLVAFATFTGSVLLFEQTQRIGQQTEVMRSQESLMRAQTASMEAQTQRLGEQTMHARVQNDLAAVNLVTDLRQQMLGSAVEGTVEQYLEDGASFRAGEALVGDLRGECSLAFNEAQTIRGPTSLATQLVIADQARDGAAADRVRKTLEYLVRDNNSSVALSALMILDSVGVAVNAEPVFLQNVVLENFEFTQPHDIYFKDSFVEDVVCSNCQITTDGSFMVEVEAQSLKGWRSIVALLNGAEDVRGIWLANEDFDLPPNPGARLRTEGFLFGERVRAHLSSGNDDACVVLGRIANESSIYRSGR